jgi:hypothetical protein
MESEREDELGNSESLSSLSMGPNAKTTVRFQLVCDDAPDLMIETLESGPRHDAMGVFVPLIGELHNERPVWQSLNKEDRLYYSSNHYSSQKCWCVSSAGNMIRETKESDYKFHYMESLYDAKLPHMAPLCFTEQRYHSNGYHESTPRTWHVAQSGGGCYGHYEWDFGREEACVTVRKCTPLEKTAAEKQLQVSRLQV